RSRRSLPGGTYPTSPETCVSPKVQHGPVSITNASRFTSLHHDVLLLHKCHLLAHPMRDSPHFQRPGIGRLRTEAGKCPFLCEVLLPPDFRDTESLHGHRI